ncbi:hypothetical protein K470DRAFT_254371 [Piedraia hortae CBS 480.64]|uniref:Pentatricopeptide repeat protein n=1 Tax=Piedraia hortae CBS 480.64 TaxID=1314780 RepID=A0A6A7CAM0_9PEZI|nr:hypothetical protein K470DRAFT_254371 [Piedraia hortae CBS 480.64]
MTCPMSNALVRLWTARLASRVALCSAVFYDFYFISKSGVKEDARRAIQDAQKVEDVFIKALVSAGSCSRHVDPWKSSRRPRPRASRSFSTSSFSASEHAISKQEYCDLVQTYGPLRGEPERKHMPLAPRLTMTPQQETVRVVSPPEDQNQAQILAKYRRLLGQKRGYISLGELWDTYLNIKAPRVHHLTDRDIKSSFQHLSSVRHKNVRNAVHRYLALLEECLSEGVQLSASEWNSAIAFTGKWVRHATSKELKATVESWMRMEQSGHQATHVTLNILFDVAVSAGRFALADTIHRELRSRNFLLDRFHRTSIIYYKGILGDGDGVRQAFRDLVNADEFVDTGVMNCVIVSMLRAGEPAAAEAIFTKMKQLVEEKMGTESLRTWQERKRLGKQLNRKAQQLRRERREHEASYFGSQTPLDERQQKIQMLTPISPDAGTYCILLQHHSNAANGLLRIAELIEEMHQRGLEIAGNNFVHIFRGFWRFGNDYCTQWTRARLEEVWQQFCQAVVDTYALGTEPDMYAGSPPFFSRATVQIALKAFYKCAGAAKMQEVWKYIKTRWKNMGPADEEIVQRLVDRLSRGDGTYIK